MPGREFPPPGRSGPPSRPGPPLATEVITGFPGETEVERRAALGLLREVEPGAGSMDTLFPSPLDPPAARPLASFPGGQGAQPEPEPAPPPPGPAVDGALGGTAGGHPGDEGRATGERSGPVAALPSRCPPVRPSDRRYRPESTGRGPPICSGKRSTGRRIRPPNRPEGTCAPEYGRGSSRGRETPGQPFIERPSIFHVVAGGFGTSAQERRTWQRSI